MLTPKEIVLELDKYIVGQKNAKRAVAIALRNRWRRQQVESDLKEEITPKNIIMMGPTGVGKTEIARRLAKLADSPFLKIEASKFTEVGYVGKDVESMIRDLTELSVKMTKEEEKKKVSSKAKERAEEKVLDLLLPPIERRPAPLIEQSRIEETNTKTREKFREMFKQGLLNDREVILKLEEKRGGLPLMVEVFTNQPPHMSMEEMGTNLKEMMGNMMSPKTKTKKVKVPEAIEILTQQEAQRLIDMDKVIELALKRVQESGIIFLDEIDKVASRVSTHARIFPEKAFNEIFSPLSKDRMFKPNMAW